MAGIRRAPWCRPPGCGMAGIRQRWLPLAARFTSCCVHLDISDVSLSRLRMPYGDLVSDIWSAPRRPGRRDLFRSGIKPVPPSFPCGPAGRRICGWVVTSCCP